LVFLFQGQGVQINLDDAKESKTKITESEFKWLHQANDLALKNGTVNTEQHKEIGKAIDTGDRDKLNKLLDDYGVKQQFYELMKLVQLQSQSKEILENAAAKISEAAAVAFGNRQLIDGPMADKEAFNEALEKSKKKGREYQSDNVT